MDNKEMFDDEIVEFGTTDTVNSVNTVNTVNS